MGRKKKNPTGAVLIHMLDDKERLEKLAKELGVKATPLAHDLIMHGLNQIHRKRLHPGNLDVHLVPPSTDNH